MKSLFTQILKQCLSLFSMFILLNGFLFITCTDNPPSEELDMSKPDIIHGSFEEKFTQYKEFQYFSGSKTQIWEEKAWKGERIYKQIVLWSSSDIKDIQYSLTELESDKGSIPLSAMKFYFGQYVTGDPEARSCSKYSSHPVAVRMIDALSTIKKTTLKANDPIKMWLVIDIPQTTHAGVYSGNLTIIGSGSSKIIFDLKITVSDRILPSADKWSFHLDLWQFPATVLEINNKFNPNNKVELWSDKHLSILETAYKYLAGCGQKVITAYIVDGALGSESMIKWIKKENGNWQYDFTAFDKYVSTLMSWGINKQISCFSPYGWNGSRISYWDEVANQKRTVNPELDSEFYSERWDHFLTEFKIHLKNKGWFEKTVLYMDEIAEEDLKLLLSIIHGNDPKWKLGIAYMHPISSDIRSSFYDFSGILEHASNEGIAYEKVSTFYTSCTQLFPNSYVTPQNNTAEMTWMAWHALNENYAGYLRWAFDYWQLTDPFDIRDGKHTAGDFSLIYRSSNIQPMEYLPSLRLEMLRDGIQDFEKVKLLRQELSTSHNQSEIQLLNTLENVISKFDRNSGTQALSLVKDAQSLLDSF